jgi:hypothetical protein
LNKKIIATTLFLSMLLSLDSQAQSVSDLDLEFDEPEDVKLLLQDFPTDKTISSEEEEAQEAQSQAKVDDLESLKEDLGQVEFSLPDDEDIVKQIDQAGSKKGARPSIFGANAADSEMVFDVGREEKELLEIAKTMQGKIPDNEWNEIAGATAESSYTVVKNDWLWKISQKLFGSGFYYSKIWSLNPYITNPHEIEPGMILTFTTGSSDQLPEIAVGGSQRVKDMESDLRADGFEKWGDDARPDWIVEKEKLKEKGVYFQYSSLETDEDLKAISEQGLIREYEAYEPPRPDFEIEIPADQYDNVGFDKSAKISYNFKEGFYLNTFVSSNVVQDFGKIEAAIDSKTIFTQHDNVYVKFDENIDVVAGDKYSVYTSAGEVKHANSDRSGFKYTIAASIQTIQKHGHLWECRVIESSSVMHRNDRITVYTPKIERITKTFNSRLVESVVMGAFDGLKTFASFGDVVYLDRGRADGVEMGNVFEVYGFKDHATGKNITDNPTYKSGEVTIISLTDNFATGLVTQSVRDFEIGDVAITKTKEAAARAMNLKKRLEKGDHTRLESQALDELDVELNLDDLNDALLDKADRIQFTEDELAELERQEREKSIMTESERDLRSLERLEKEIETAEKMLNEARLDEDKLLEGQSLDKVEQSLLYQQQESLDEIEENFGKRYLDEDLNDKENPYGLTEFDIEEIDELLNVEKELEDQR